MRNASVNAIMGTEDPGAREFLITGIVSALDPLTRVLHIGGHQLWVPPEISLATVAIGARSTVFGLVGMLPNYRFDRPDGTQETI